MRAATALIVASATAACTANASSPSAPPDARVSVRLTGGWRLHLLPLPLGRMSGVVRGKAFFDATGTRVLFIGVFPGSTVGGDWRRMQPSEAFFLDMGRRRLTQLTDGASAFAIRWAGNNGASISEADGEVQLSVPAPMLTSSPAGRLSASDESAAARVSPADLEQVAVRRRADGRFAIIEAGNRFPLEGLAPNGSYAVTGSFVAWVDRSADSGRPIERAGPDDTAPPSFAGSVYGDALTSINPLGHFVYQGAYRNGVAYFPYSSGLGRAVAETADFQSYSYAAIPSDIGYSTGDGFGAGPDGSQYFAWPEGGTLAYLRRGRYVRRTTHMPDGARSQGPLWSAMSRLARAEDEWPPLHPAQDALDAALLSWRVYPVGDALGQRWIASFLGRAYTGGDDGIFRAAPAPAFPFAVLGRTDDGRLWGAAPATRTVSHGIVSSSSSILWSSRDAEHWRAQSTLEGDAGAVGLHHGDVWVALTRSWRGRPTIALARLANNAGAQTQSALTAATYDGEGLFFADLRAGFFLVLGATPGWRLASEGGPLSAFRIDPAVLFAKEHGVNDYMRQRDDVAADPSLPSAPPALSGAAAILRPTLALLGNAAGVRPTLVTNIAVSGTGVPTMV
ncbi:MAG: hypothetical protein GIW99_03850, partial [Candidatus Eremiobacteraeota bacterium]|nr:hypothetical protein [Candidatus Eremiobacteraeota bacterium]